MHTTSWTSSCRRVSDLDSSVRCVYISHCSSILAVSHTNRKTQSQEYCGTYELLSTNETNAPRDMKAHRMSVLMVMVMMMMMPDVLGT